MNAVDPKGAVVYLVEDWYYDNYSLIAAYDNEEAAIAHANDPEVVAEFGKFIGVREVGIRSRVQFKKPHERMIK